MGNVRGRQVGGSPACISEAPTSQITSQVAKLPNLILPTLQSSLGHCFQTVPWRSWPAWPLSMLRPQWPLTYYPQGRQRLDGWTLTLLLGHRVSSPPKTSKGKDFQMENPVNMLVAPYQGGSSPFLGSSVTLLHPLHSVMFICQVKHTAHALGFLRIHLLPLIISVSICISQSPPQGHTLLKRCLLQPGLTFYPDDF